MIAASLFSGLFWLWALLHLWHLCYTAGPIRTGTNALLRNTEVLMIVMAALLKVTLPGLEEKADDRGE